ncbi:MAG: glycerophosphoryl diester phosphodiesterase [Acidobacteriota bacterium]|nr:glycerophosphoryl diester phosphodiesterase [Acidobacteriota bacterium]
MALKHCWQKKRLEAKEYGDRYLEQINSVKKGKNPGFKNNVSRVGIGAKHRVSVSWNWLKVIPCILFEIIQHLPMWIIELFRFCPGCDQTTIIDESFLIVGHRGAAAYEVENTIPSFQRALDNYGANALEIDICLTADQQVVVWHDWDPNSTIATARQLGLEPDVMCKPFILGSQKKQVHELTLKVLRKQYGYTKKKGKSKKLDADIPTLREVFQWAQEQPKLRCLFLDVKTPPQVKNLIPPMMKEIKRLLDEFKPAFPVIFLTPENDILEAMQTVESHLNYSYDADLPLVFVLDPEAYSCVQKAIDLKNTYASIGRPTILNLGPWTTYRRVIEYDIHLKEKYNVTAEKRIKGLIAWTINRRREMRCLIRMGVNGILTDKPDRLSAQVQKIKKGPLIQRLLKKKIFSLGHKSL